MVKLQVLSSTEAYGEIAAPTIFLGPFLDEAIEAEVNGLLDDFA